MVCWRFCLNIVFPPVHISYWTPPLSLWLYLPLINVTVFSSTACPQTISEIARPNVCAHSGMSKVCLSPPSPIASLIRSAPQNGKQMDVAVGEKNAVCVRLCSYGYSQKIAEVRCVQSLLYHRFKLGLDIHTRQVNTCVIFTVNRVVVWSSTPQWIFAMVFTTYCVENVNVSREMGQFNYISY